MQDELQLHLELTAQAMERRGLSKEDAARAARLQAGAVPQTMERMRDQRGLPWLADLVQDARFGARMLRRTPGSTAVALLTLALAIGANTAIFSLVDPLLFRDLPVRDPGSLVQFQFHYPLDPPLNNYDLTSYELFRDRSTAFSDMFGLAPLSPEPRPGGEPMAAQIVTGNFFEALGVQPAMGRVLEASD